MRVEGALWQSSSAEAKDLIRHLMAYDPLQRLAVADALGRPHPWLALGLEGGGRRHDPRDQPPPTTPHHRAAHLAAAANAATTPSAPASAHATPPPQPSSPPLSPPTPPLAPLSPPFSPPLALNGGGSGGGGGDGASSSRRARAGSAIFEVQSDMSCTDLDFVRGTTMRPALPAPPLPTMPAMAGGVGANGGGAGVMPAMQGPPLPISMPPSAASGVRHGHEGGGSSINLPGVSRAADGGAVVVLPPQFEVSRCDSDSFHVLRRAPSPLQKRAKSPKRSVFTQIQSLPSLVQSRL